MDKKELFQAIKSKDPHTIKEVVRLCPNLMTEKILRKSLLNYALELKDIDLLKHFLDLGLSIDYADGCAPPISTAIYQKDVSSLRWLINNGADVNITRAKPLIYEAIYSGSVEITELLIENGINLALSWQRFKTPFDYALALKDNPPAIARIIGEKQGLAPDYVESQIVLALQPKQELKVEKKFTEEKLELIEKTLDIRIPAFYREFLLSFPDALVSEEDTGVFDSAEQIINSTKASRDYREQEWTGGYSNDLLSVGWNGGGSVFCIRESQTEESIYLFDHDRGDINLDETIPLNQFIEIWSQQRNA